MFNLLLILDILKLHHIEIEIQLFQFLLSCGAISIQCQKEYDIIFFGSIYFCIAITLLLLKKYFIKLLINVIVICNELVNKKMIFYIKLVE